MNEISIFTNPEFGKIRTVALNGEPWFVGKDVAEALGYGKGKSLNNAIASHVDCEDKGVTEMMTPGGLQKVTVINESGLYSLILSSKLPTAKAFKRWVTAEVLPQLRRTGTYGIGIEEIITTTAVTMASELMKALAPVLAQAASEKTARAKQSALPTARIRKAYRYVQPSKISTLPPELRVKIDDMIVSGDYSCQQIANFIMNNSDIKISQMAVSRYKHTHFTFVED
ncbi:MAG: Bro-N domain-containing protein [Bacteroides sp.]|nr:Bro-N domain-containing protein [Eubacterium sp.]MCM1419428.1 Bro-N domain-containing protein [Roseburia sp.]MCM1462985.1 Bro-N domain-containing protein [Bacteroides sp.]